jgi:hypothetical protein
MFRWRLLSVTGAERKNGTVLLVDRSPNEEMSDVRSVT